MLLHCTLAGRAGSVIGHPTELSVEVPAGCSGARLQEAVARRFGTGQLVVEGAPLSVLTVGTAPLVNGAVLTDGWAGSELPNGSPAAPGPSLLLAVLSGPGSGMILPLHRGSYRIGRSGSDLAIPDTDISREHARLDVTDCGITLVDLGSANGTWVDGRRLLSAPVSTGSLIRCGNSTLALLFREVLPEGPGLRAAGEDTSEPLLVSGPRPAVQRGSLVLAAVLPLAAGVVLAAVTGMWMFLAFTAFSAFPLLLPAVFGRRQRRELRDTIAAAVRLDVQRRRQAAPSAARLVLDAVSDGPRKTVGEPGSQPGRNPEAAAETAEPVDSGPIWLRLGLAEQAANIRQEPLDPAFRAPPAGLLPVTLSPSAAALLEGPPQAVTGLVRFFLMQLAGYPRGYRTWVHVHGPVQSIPLAARFLARVSLSTDPSIAAARLKAGPGPGYDRGVLILLPGTGAADALRADASLLGWQLIDCEPAAATAAGGAQRVTLCGSIGRLTSGEATREFLPDFVPEQIFDRFCRQRRDGGVPARGPAAVPASCSLDEVLPLSEALVSCRWALAGRPQGEPSTLAVPVGVGAAGPLSIDLQSDGPHLLVAGTTGSGKSEFLRTLVAGLAISCRPDQVNFLFVDFKGGSGLAPLAGLPHCVGLITDLDTYDMDRTLTSLRAEVRRREKVLADAAVSDLASYQTRGTGFPALPHLVLVIDEFRMLVEDAPAALADLMRVAVIGRSLGIHLIMATQRPQGALTADIRANVTSCVVLRVQSDLESADVMNSRLAAAIPAECPGRAYLIRGNRAPEEFQTASVSGPMRVPAVDTVTVMCAAALLELPSDVLSPALALSAPATAPAESVLPIVELTARLWRSHGGAPARRPVATPLPPALVFPGGEEFDGADRPTAREAKQRSGADYCQYAQAPAEREVLLGMVDLPEQQQVGHLTWNPADQGHLALVGAMQNRGSDGCVETILLVLDQLIRADAESHLYLLDADGSLAEAAPSPRVGAWVGRQDLKRASRVLARLGEEMTSRLALAPARKPQPLTLVLHNWGSWVSAFRSGPLVWAEDLMHDIIRDGPKAGIVAVLSGERELVTSRFFAAVPNRIYFPGGSTEEGRLAWPPMPRLPALPGRVVVSGIFAGNKAPPGDGAPAGNSRHTGDKLRVAQLYKRPVGTEGGPLPDQRTGATKSRPFRVEALPALVTVEEVRSRLESAQLESTRPGAAGRAPALYPAAASGNGRLWAGVAGDELLPAGIVLPNGGVLAVIGGQGSGKSSLLRALPHLNPFKTWIHPGEEPGREAFWSGIHAQAVTGALDPAAIILADDLDLATSDVNDMLLQLNGLGSTVIFTAGYSPALQQRVPLALSARSQGKAILIGPRSLIDGDLFGVRFDPEPRAPAGRAVMISDGRVTAVQLALAVEHTGPDSRPKQAATDVTGEPLW